MADVPNIYSGKPIDPEVAKKIADALLQKPPDPQDPYYSDLGRFVTGFANTEAHVRQGLRKLLGLSDTDMAALFHKWGLLECIEGINRIIAARGDADMAGRLKEPFAQLHAIAEIRNALVHWDTKLETPIGFIAANAHRAHRPEKAVEYRVDREQLERMSEDLQLIVARLILGITWAEMHAASWPEKDDFLSRVVPTVLQVPWSYKRPQPGQ